MTMGLKANADGSGAIQVGGSDAITITSGLVVSLNGGANYPLLRATAVASTSGTSIDFTSLPSWVRRITVMFNGVSTSGGAVKFIRIGTGGTPATTGYSGVGGVYYSTNSAGATSFTTALCCNDNTASSTLSGHAILTNISGNTWVGSLTMASPAGTAQMFNSTCTITLAGALDIVRITTSNGTDTFDAGTINIIYE